MWPVIVLSLSLSYEMFLEDFQLRFDLNPLERLRRRCLMWDRPCPEIECEFEDFDMYHALPESACSISECEDKYSEWWWKSLHVQYWYMLFSDSAFAKSVEIENERQFVASGEREVVQISYETLCELCGSKLQGEALEDVSDVLIENTKDLDTSSIFSHSTRSEFKHCMAFKCKEILPVILECMGN